MSYSALGVAPLIVCRVIVRLAEFFWSSVRVAGTFGIRCGEGSSSEVQMRSGRSSCMEASKGVCVVCVLLVEVAVRVRCRS
jgi:hypothetical protein